MGTQEQNSNLKKSIRDKCRDEQGLTIVEVMVAFVLVLLAIAMITTVTMMTSRIQKQTKESQDRAAQLAELTYRQLQPEYDADGQMWKTDTPETGNEATVTLQFIENGRGFDMDVNTADWVVSDSAIHTTYHIYRPVQ